MARPDGWAGGLKRTRQRTLVLDVLERANLPMSASEISRELAQHGTPVCLSTVYRVLETFAGNGMLQKTTLLENSAAVYELCAYTHRHYAVCLGCRRMVPLEECPLERFEPRLCEQGFHVTGHRLQMFGFCSGCAKEARKQKQIAGEKTHAEQS